MTCSRVIIINQGRIQASDTPENLVAQIRTSGLVKLEAKTRNDDALAALRKIAGVKSVHVVEEDGWQRFSIRVEADADPREAIYRLAVDRHWIVRELAQERATLEDAFVELTQTDA